jgi:prepilin-type N-terminal cleavage/methylation domain-containing protein
MHRTGLLKAVMQTESSGFTAVPPAPTSACRQRGFTLTEMAVVLIIVALLLGGMVMPLSAQRDLRDAGETRKQLAESIEALYGYAASRPGKPHLPCPDTDADGLENRNPDGACANVFGDLPWADLGIGRRDAWGANPLRYAVTPEFAHSTGFALLTSGTLRVCADTGCAASIATRIPAVVFVQGRNLASEQQPAASPPTFFDMTPDAAFDDLVAWLPPSILNNRMIAACRLP